MNNLTRLYPNGNKFSGHIPSEIGNLINLEKLNLSVNQLSGEIPSSIGNLTKLNNLFLNQNRLSGLIPNSICDQGDNSPGLSDNFLCSPYLICI